MKKTILATAVILTLSACSSTKNADVRSGAGIGPSAGAQQAIADQRLAVSDFRSRGIRISYTMGGDIESIEAHGYAAVWGNSMNSAREAYRTAELEAKKSLNDFINKETISSTVSVRMISQNLERASDQNTNRFATNKTDGELVALDSTPASTTGSNSDVTQAENTAVRNHALRLASTLNTTITTNNRGILGGLYLKESRVIDNGRAVEVVMRWDRKSNQARPQLRNLMAQ